MSLLIAPSRVALEDTPEVRLKQQGPSSEHPRESFCATDKHNTFAEWCHVNIASMQFTFVDRFAFTTSPPS
jgi:hypothetical protein